MHKRGPGCDTMRTPLPTETCLIASNICFFVRLWVVPLPLPGLLLSLCSCGTLTRHVFYITQVISRCPPLFSRVLCVRGRGRFDCVSSGTRLFRLCCLSVCPLAAVLPESSDGGLRLQLFPERPRGLQGREAHRRTGVCMNERDGRLLSRAFFFLSFKAEVPSVANLVYRRGSSSPTRACKRAIDV